MSFNDVQCHSVAHVTPALPSPPVRLFDSLSPSEKSSHTNSTVPILANHKHCSQCSRCSGYLIILDDTVLDDA